MDIADDTSNLLRSCSKGFKQRQQDILLELKPKTRRGKCLGAAQLQQETTASVSTESDQPARCISLDIWLHIADHIEPEDVQRFALICITTANIVQTRGFWLKLYKKYCQAKSKEWNLKLPSNLQAYAVASESNAQRLRFSVIQSLFHCRDLLQQKVYSDEFLIGRAYIASWHFKCSGIMIMIYKFRLSTVEPNNNQQAFQPDMLPDHLVNELDWEALHCNTNNNDKLITKTAKNKQDNKEIYHCLLVICSQNFVPFPMHLIYNGDSPARVAALRCMLANDMRGSNLEIDFIDTGRCKTTVKYPNIKKHKIIPCWHPDYMKFNKQ